MNKKADDPSNRSARIRSLLAKGDSPGAIAKALDCPIGAVYVVRSRLKGGHGKAKLAPKSTPKPRKATKPVAQLVRAAVSMNGMDNVLAAVKALDGERSRMTKVLAKIRQLLED